MVLFWVVCAVLAAMVFKWAPAIRRFKERYDYAQTLRGPSMWDLIDATRKQRVLDFFGECRQKYGPVFRIWLGPELVLFFTDPNDVKTILTSNALVHKAKGYDTARPWLGNGLLTNGGDSWHQKRKLLTPAFHFQILSTFREPMEECCDILIDRLNEVADGRPVDIYQYITLFTLDVICETAMGIKVNAQKNQDSAYVKATKQMCFIIHRQILSAWKRIPFLYQFSADRKQRDQALKILHGETKRVIKLRRRQLDEAATKATGTNNAQDRMADGTPKRRLAFLDSLLLMQREGGQLTDANIQEEVDTFMFEGHDTTSSAISFIIFVLATHPEAQRLVYEEISSLNEMDDLQSLPYLEAVIKETLRLYPAVPSFSRQTKEPFKLGQSTVPADVTIVTNAFWVHREPKHHTDPEAFRPERYLGSSKQHAFAHVAFSAGPRNCIGQRFAMLELKCSVSRLVRAFEFSPVPGFVALLQTELVLKSGNGVLVQLRKRTAS